MNIVFFLLKLLMNMVEDPILQHKFCPVSNHWAAFNDEYNCLCFDNFFTYVLYFLCLFHPCRSTGHSLVQTTRAV